MIDIILFCYTIIMDNTDRRRYGSTSATSYSLWISMIFNSYDERDRKIVATLDETTTKNTKWVDQCKIYVAYTQYTYNKIEQKIVQSIR